MMNEILKQIKFLVEIDKLLKELYEKCYIDFRFYSDCHVSICKAIEKLLQKLEKKIEELT